MSETCRRPARVGTQQQERRLRPLLRFEVAGLTVAAVVTLVAWRSWYWPGWLVMAGVATGGNLLGWWSVRYG